MIRGTRPRLAAASLVAAAAMVGFVGVAAGHGSDDVLSAIEAAATATDAVALAGQVPILGAGGALIGLGVGVALASGVTYWYQSKQIGGRLE